MNNLSLPPSSLANLAPRVREKLKEAVSFAAEMTDSDPRDSEEPYAIVAIVRSHAAARDLHAASSTLKPHPRTVC